jgi:hypothetical protein
MRWRNRRRRRCGRIDILPRRTRKEEVTRLPQEEVQIVEIVVLISDHRW